MGLAIAPVSKYDENFPADVPVLKLHFISKPPIWPDFGKILSMSTESATRTSNMPPPLPRAAPLLQAFIALTAGMALFLVLLVGSMVAFDMVNSGKILPGVSLAGIDLSGLTPEEASSLVTQKIAYPTQGSIAFQDGSKVWIAKPSELGLFLDPQTSARAAYQKGRQGSPLERLSARFQAWYSGVDIPPLMVFDERMTQKYLRGIAAEIDLPTVEASLSVSGTEVVVQPGQVGRTLDIDTALQDLREHIPSMTDGIIYLQVRETPPVILDVSEQAEIARRILSAPLVLQVPNAEEGDPDTWTFEPAVLAEMLTIERVENPEGARYQVALNSETMRPFLEGVAPQLARLPENARFIFNDETRQLEVIQPAVIGRELDVDATLQKINQRVAEGDHNLELVVNYTSPQVGDDAVAEDLGIRELVASHTSYFYGSSGSRVQNIEVAASRFHGVMVPPGATFSMVDVLGEISLDDGYAEALIIFGGRTIKGVGGGVCQVSTTLFRTVFFGGFPIVERHPHAYRVGYYEQTSGGGINQRLAGLDATVFVPVVDFKFRNDTDHWLLMETYTNPGARTLTWKFYSTSDGRTVEWDSSGPRNVVAPPKPSYEENPELAAGEIKQVDWEAEGADVSVTRTVMRDGQVHLTDTINTHYLPWRAVYQYGPGTDGMPPEGSEETEENNGEE
jgi:vancomycin resistance protein YoaR